MMFPTVAKPIGTIPMELIRCDNKRVHVLEGFGGKRITAWRVHKIIEIYISGRKAQAKSEYVDWYWSQFRRYAMVPKRVGGMYRGSLFSLVQRAHRMHGLRFNGRVDRANECIVQRCIEDQVVKRFGLVDSVIEKGYSPRSRDPISVIGKHGLYYLIEGHHRVATLSALGYREVPNLYSFDNQILHRIWSGIKRLQG